MSLFVPGRCTLASGQRAEWKINCDSLCAGDWEALALMARQIVPSFGAVVGVPSGGLSFARALEPYVTDLEKYGEDGDLDLLVVDDVWTTGGSVRKLLGQLKPYCRVGVLVAFSREPKPRPLHGDIFSKVWALWRLGT